MKTILFGKGKKIVAKESQPRRGRAPKARNASAASERDLGTPELTLQKARVLPVRAPLELSENALAILFAHREITSQERRAGDLFAIGRARDCGSAHPHIGFYEHHIRGTPDADANIPSEDIWNSILTYRMARNVLMRSFPAGVFKEVWAVAIESRTPQWFTPPQYRIPPSAPRTFLHLGLGALTKLYEVR